MKTIFAISIFFFVATFSNTIQAQINPSSMVPFNGRVIDATDNTPLPGANVVFSTLRDTTRKFGQVTDLDGNFSFPRVISGMKVKLDISYIGYHTYSEEYTFENLNEVKIFRLKPDVEQLEGVEITAVQTRVEMKGDTAQYNAAAFKVNKDASAQDLLTKMPGVVNQNGQLQAQGEQVKRVTVDGQEFFGDDPSLALKSLPAEVISQIQIFDRQSDQAQFTGFQDGNTEKTINIITKGGLQNGTFGRLFGAYGSQERYLAGGNVNYFKGSERISILGLTNNINQQNFSTEDLVGLAQSGGRGGMGGGFGGFGGGNVGNFMVGQSAGISKTNSIGFNYSNEWAKKLKLNASYFFNSTNNNTDKGTYREYYTDDLDSQFYDESNISKSDNYNHRFNARAEYTLDKNNSFIITPRLSLQDNTSSSLLNGETSLGQNTILNQLQNQNGNYNQAFSFNNSLLWRHRFEKNMRTLSLDFRTSVNNRDGNSSVYSQNDILYPITSQRITDQKSDIVTDNYSIGVSASFTEPVFDKKQLMIRYQPEFTSSKSDQLTYAPDPGTTAYNVIQPTLSSQLDSKTFSQQGGISLRSGGFTDPRSWMLSLNIQQTNLDGTQVFPTAFDLNKNWFKVLPGLMWGYRNGQAFNMNIFYRTSVQTPGISQFQPMINNTNPMFLSSGNPNLDQQYNHSVFSRMQLINVESGKSVFLFINASLSNSYLGNSTIIASQDTTLANGIHLVPGSQFSRPENLSGYKNLRTFGTFSLPSALLSSTLNFNAGFTYAGTPSIINTVTSITNTYSTNAGLTISSNVSEKVDFTLQYSANFTSAENELQPRLNANYYNGLASGKVQFLLWDQLVIASDINYSHYSGLTDGYNQNFALWNASIGYKFLKNKQAEIRISLFDILKANKSINRNVTETYFEDVQTNIINQYALVTFIYNLRSFVTGPPKDEHRPPFMPGRHNGPPRGGRWN